MSRPALNSKQDLYSSVNIVDIADDEIQLDLKQVADKEVTFLGDLRPGAKNKIDPSSCFGRLPRPAIKDLPGPHSADREFGSLSGTPTEETFLKLYEGSFVLVAKQAKMESAAHYVYTISAVVTEGDFVGPLLAISFGYKQGTVPDDLKLHTGCKDGDKFIKSLRDPQRMALYSRLNHLFLRTLGAWLDPEVFHFLARALAIDYQQVFRRKELLDLAVIRADLSFNNHNQTADWVIHNLIKVGECMEAIGPKNYEAASALYLEILSEHWTPNVEDPTRGQANLLGMAGVAIGRDQKYGQAEVLLLRSLQAEVSENGWDLACEHTVSNLPKLYFTWIDLAPEDWNKIHSFPWAFVSLLICAETNLADDVVRHVGRDRARGFLKAKVAKKKAARKALSFALMSKFGPDHNVVGFRQEIVRHCTSQKLELKTHHDGKSIEQRKVEHSKAAKELARSLVTGNGGSTKTTACGSESCSNA